MESSQSQSRYMQIIGFTLIFIMISSSSSSSSAAAGDSRCRVSVSSSEQSVKAAYWPSYRMSSMPPSSINATLYTHIFYAFADMDEQTFQVKDQKIMGDFTPALLQRNPCVKTLISIGGGGSNATAFALMAANAFRRKVFIDSAIALARRHAFHGLDLDWEFPQNTTQMENLGRLFSEWRRSIHLEAGRRRPLLLTAAVYFAQRFFVWGERRSYPTASIAKNLDWVNVMCFDYHGSWDTSATGAHAALYDRHSNISSSYGIGSWLASGLPPHKLVMGMPMYGRSWILKTPNGNQTGIGAPAVAAGPKQTLSNESGVMFYSEIREFIRDKNATEVFDKETVSAYSYSYAGVGLLWVGYDNQHSVAAKIIFAKAKGLLGYFFWEMTQDSNWMLATQASVSWN